jgi:hypothetical protein
MAVCAVDIAFASETEDPGSNTDLGAVCLWTGQRGTFAIHPDFAVYLEVFKISKWMKKKFDI